MSDQKICPTCGTEYPLSERFCPRDGTALRSATAQADLLGSIVADRYHVIRKLGEGGMGTVYLAEHVKMGRKSALKVMNPGMHTDPDAIARFNREAANASRLSHPNICGIYDFGETPDGLIYLAMEFIEGSSLTTLVEKAGSLPAARCGSIIHQTADALQVAHDAGIVHRDLKPDNIMIARARDGADHVKVVDFGIAKASSSDAQKVTRTGLVVGTPEYMSPEQLAGDTLDGRSDIYSLGLVAFNCLTGKLPFPAETVQEAMIMRLTDRPRTLAETSTGITWTAELQRTLDKALERDASARYASAAEFGREFAAAIAAMPSTRAAEAGTQLIDAGAAGASTRAVPPTRAAHVNGSTVPIRPVHSPRDAAPVRKKSALPMILGGGGLIAASLAAFMIFKPPAAGDAADPLSAAHETLSQDPRQNPQGTKQDPPQQPQSSGDAPVTKPFNRTIDAGTNNTVPSGNDRGAVASGNDRPAVSPAPADADSVEETRFTTAQLLSRARAQLDNENITAASAQRILRRVRRLRSSRRQSMSQPELADSWFVEMMAHVALNDTDGTCTAAKQVLRLSTKDADRSVATFTGCQ